MIKLKNILREVIEEGVYDPGILKAVFLAGGPGSGKTTVADQLLGVNFNSFSDAGLKPVNSDKFFEFLLKSRNITTDLASLSPEEFSKVTVGPDSEREKAKGLLKTSYTYYVGGRLGVIIDGTGDDPEKTRKQAEELQQVFGYDVAMVFVNTSLDKAIDRNNHRERKLPAEMVTSIWNQAQKAKEIHKRFFGANFIEVTNEKDIAPGKPIDINPQVQKAVQAFLRKPIQNPVGKEWIKKALAAKSSMNEAEQSQYEIFCDMDGVLCDFVRQWRAYFGEDPDTMRRRIGKPAFDEKLNAMDYKFWYTMKPMPGALEKLWPLIGKYGARILSSPSDDPKNLGTFNVECTKAKSAWVKSNLGSNVEVIFRKSTNKQEFSAPNKILVDDLKRNIDQWNAKQGTGILFLSADQAVRDLNKLNIK
jgi:chloramphenicol 3-O-phosphotransferase